MVSVGVSDDISMLGFRGLISSSLNSRGSLIRGSIIIAVVIRYDRLNISLDAKEAT